MTILLAGASGFVGIGLLKELEKTDHRIIAVTHSRQSSDELHLTFPSVTVLSLDVSDPLEVQGKLPEGFETVIYLPGLLREFPRKGISFQKVHVEGVRNLIAEAKRMGAKRWVQMSALGARQGASTKYFQTKWKAEELVRSSGLDWTIIRPSVIFDDKPNTKINFISELSNVIELAPVIPVFGNGKYRLQPISLHDVAGAIVQSLAKPETIGQTYELGGPEKLTYDEIMLQITRAMGKKKPLVHIPFAFVEPLAKLLGGFKFFPVTTDQLTMLKEENICKDPEMETVFRTTFELRLIQFAEGLQGYFRTP